MIDVGANVGQYAQRLRGGRLGRPDPLDRAHPRGARPAAGAAAADPAWEVAPPLAAGAAAGEIVLEVSAESDMSSTLPQSALLRDISPTSAVQRRVAVPQRRLDELGPAGRPAVAAPVRQDRRSGRGAGGAAGLAGVWERVQGLQLELALLPLYEGERPWLDLVGDLAGRGFAPYLMFPGYFSRALGPPGTARHGVLSRVKAQVGRDGTGRNLELGASADPSGRLAVHRGLPGGVRCCSAGCGRRCSGSACSPPPGASTSFAIRPG